MPRLSRRSILRERLPLGLGVAFLALLLTANIPGSAGHALVIAVPSASATPSAGNATTYPVNFTVVGRPAGTPWNLTILQQSWATTGPYILLREPNGSYPYAADSANFPGNRFANGSFVVAGHSVNISLMWATSAPVAPPNATASTPASTTFGGSLFVVIVAVLVIGVVGALAVAARGRPSASPEAAEETPLGAPGADLARRPGGSESPDDPLGHML